MARRSLVSLVLLQFGCADVEGGSDVDLSNDASSRHRLVELESGNRVEITWEVDGVSVTEHGQLPNPSVLSQPEMANATPLEVFWAIAGDDEEPPLFLIENHDRLGELEPHNALEQVLDQEAGWLRRDLDSDLTWRAAADCVDFTYSGVNCLPEAGYNVDTCELNQDGPWDVTDSMSSKFRGAVCGQGAGFQDKLQYQRQQNVLSGCDLEASVSTVWHESIIDDEYKVTTWTSTMVAPWVYRSYRHRSSHQVPGTNFDWSSMTAFQGSCT